MSHRFVYKSRQIRKNHEFIIAQCRNIVLLLDVVFGEVIMHRYLIVKGEPASKANSRRLITVGGSPRFIKSAKALNYAEAFNLQVKRVDPLLEGELRVDMWIYYASQRPDLDESLILDLLQNKLYLNDRQVRERHIHHFVDKEDPRVEILIQQRESEIALEASKFFRKKFGMSGVTLSPEG